MHTFSSNLRCHCSLSVGSLTLAQGNVQMSAGKMARTSRAVDGVMIRISVYVCAASLQDLLIVHLVFMVYRDSRHVDSFLMSPMCNCITGCFLVYLHTSIAQFRCKSNIGPSSSK